MTILHKRILLSLAALLIFAYCLTMPAKRVQAHGGFVIQSGEVDHFEWAVSVFPYPVAPGATVISILVYDKTTGLPYNDFTGDVYLAEPGNTEPCCKPEVHRGPFRLLSDHIQYPGDYTAFLPIDAAGKWGVQFVLESEKDGKYGVVVEMDALPPAGDPNVDKAAIATQVSIASSAAATAMANNALAAPGQAGTSPLAQPAAQAQAASPLAAVSPLTVAPESSPAAPAENSSSTQIETVTEQVQPSPTNRNLWIFGGLAFVVLVGVVGAFFFSQPKNNAGG